MADPGANPVRAIYGFAFYFITYGLLVLYILWAFLPDHWLHSIGLTYLPQKYWAVAVPVYGMVLIVTAIVMYMGYSMWITPSLESTRTITDSHSIYCSSSSSVTTASNVRTSVPPLMDIPITVVNKALY